MSFLKKIFSKAPILKKEAKIIMLGPAGAGKTTFVRFLETGMPVEVNIRTTLGIDIRKTPILLDGWSFKAIDDGGQELYQRTFWALGVEQADAVVFVIDGTIRPDKDSDLFERCVFQFEYMVTLVTDSIPLLILINKQDLKELSPLTTEEAYDFYNIHAITRESVKDLPISAKYGEGVQLAVEWVIKQLSNSNS